MTLIGCAGKQGDGNVKLTVLEDPVGVREDFLEEVTANLRIEERLIVERIRLEE